MYTCFITMDERKRTSIDTLGHYTTLSKSFSPDQQITLVVGWGWGERSYS